MSADNDASDDGSTEQKHPLDIARDSCNEVNDRLADTDGAIAGMHIAGAVGYHQYVATGETDPEYLSKIALLQALDETVLEMLWIDADEPGRAAQQVQSHLERHFDAMTAENITERYQDHLEDLISVQEDNAV